MEDSERIKRLLDRYWLAETTEQEEAELRNYFASQDAKEHPLATPLFEYFNQEKHVTLDNDFEEKIKSMTYQKRGTVRWLNPLWKVAAAIILVVGLIFIFRPNDQPKKELAYTETDTFDSPRQAYLETKKALLLMSAKLNTGKSYVAEIKKINEAEQIIQSNTNSK